MVNPPALLKLKNKKNLSAFPNTQGKGPFTSARTWLFGKRLASPSAVGLALRKMPLPRVLGKTLREIFLFYPIFL